MRHVHLLGSDLAVCDMEIHCVLDVDVPEPDEKSLITYVSSLYDVFPEVPSMEQSLRDHVSIYTFNVFGA